MALRKKIVYKRGDDLFIYASDLGFCRIINEKTGEAEDTTNEHIIRRVIKKGVEAVCPDFLERGL